jgi:hypothetical protein
MGALDKATDLARRTGDARVEGMAIFNKAVALAHLGRQSDAIPLAEEALTIFTRIEDRRSESKAREKLALWRENLKTLVVYGRLR